MPPKSKPVATRRAPRPESDKRFAFPQYVLPQNIPFRSLAREHGIPFRAFASGTLVSRQGNYTNSINPVNPAFATLAPTPISARSSPVPSVPSPQTPASISPPASTPPSSSPLVNTLATPSGKRLPALSLEQYAELCRQEERVLEKVFLNCTHSQSRLPSTFFYNILNMMISEEGLDVEGLILGDGGRFGDGRYGEIYGDGRSPQPVEPNTTKENKIPTALSYIAAPASTSAASTAASLGTSPDVLTFSQEWMHGFLQRHPEVAGRVSKSVGSCDIDTFDLWFCEYLSGVHDRGIGAADTYNMADTGVYRGAGKEDAAAPEAARVIRDGGALCFQPPKSVRSQQRASHARAESVTTSAIETICADGTSLTPYVMINREMFTKDTQRAHAAGLVERFQTKGWTLAYSDDGWVDLAAGYDWLKNHFEPKTRGKAQGRPRALLLSGEMRYLSFRFLRFAMEHNIALFFFPPHTSDILQPFSIGPGKYLQTLRPIVEAIEDALNGKAAVDWLEFFDMMAQSRFVILNKGKVEDSWAAAGLLPFNPQHVVNIKFPNLNNPPLLVKQLQMKYQKWVDANNNNNTNSNNNINTNTNINNTHTNINNTNTNNTNNATLTLATALLTKMQTHIPADATNFAISYSHFITLYEELAELASTMASVNTAAPTAGTLIPSGIQTASRPTSTTGSSHGSASTSPNLSSNFSQNNQYAQGQYAHGGRVRRGKPDVRKAKRRRGSALVNSPITNSITNPIANSITNSRTNSITNTTNSNSPININNPMHFNSPININNPMRSNSPINNINSIRSNSPININTTSPGPRMPSGQFSRADLFAELREAENLARGRVRQSASARSISPHPLNTNTPSTHTSNLNTPSDSRETALLSQLLGEFPNSLNAHSFRNIASNINSINNLSLSNLFGVGFPNTPQTSNTNTQSSFPPTPQNNHATDPAEYEEIGAGGLGLGHIALSNLRAPREEEYFDFGA